MNGWLDGRAGLRIAYSNQKSLLVYLLAERDPETTFSKKKCQSQAKLKADVYKLKAVQLF